MTCRGPLPCPYRLQGIKARVGKDWYEHYVPGISKLYFMAKQHGFVPRYRLIQAQTISSVCAPLNSSLSIPSRKTTPTQSINHAMKK